MPRTIRRRRSVDIDPLVHHYLGQRMLRERAESEESRDKKEMMEVLAEAGEETPEKHRRLPITPHPYTNSKGDQKTVNGVQRQRRVNQVLDQDAAMKLLKRKKLVKECTETITVLSEDKLLAANYEGKITDEELQALYGELESFAFILEYE